MHIATKMHFLKLSCGCVAFVLISEKGASAVQVFWQGNGMSEDSRNTHFMLHLLSGRKDDSWVDHGLFHTDHTMFEEHRRTRSLEEWRFYSARDLINLQLGTEAFRIHLFRIVPESFGQLHKS